MSGGDYFEKVSSEKESYQDLLHQLKVVLEKRLPRSCFMYNQIKAYELFPEDFTFYIFRDSENKTLAGNDENNDKLEDEMWIISKFIREDWGSVLCVSPPSSTFNQTSFSTSVQSALKNSNYFDPTKLFIFVCVDTHVSDFLINHLTRNLNTVIKIIPCYLFVMEPEQALKLDVTTSSPSVRLGPLDPEKDTAVMCSNWPYTRDGTEQFIKKSVQRYISAGLYVENEKSDEKGEEFACGAIVPGFGILSSLLTLPNHRRKGYASLLEKHIYKEMAKQGYYPCLDAEISDPTAVGFHTSINGNKIISKVDYICHKHIM